jgi:3-deoxy-D-manno-octulosonate 8-phosphate phosphatase (KDO 8-P phosphatase)
MNNTLFDRLKRIRALVFDIDGVLTNNGLLLLDNGERLRTMNTRDGFALQYASEKRYRICAISEDGSEAISARLAAWGLKEVYFGVDSKLAAMERFMLEYEIDIHEVMYMGDDVNDLIAMKQAGLVCCPQDAVPEVKNIAHYIATAKGGEGCVREVIELILKSHEQWDFA